MKLFIAIILLMFACKTIYGHGAAQWIEDGKYISPLDGRLCCGEKDCAELKSEDVKTVNGGFYIVSLKEFVPMSEALPSPTGTYWRCYWGGQRKCFFYPPPGS